MKSMTGYGRATAALDGFSVTIQVSSVNRKSLDLTIGLPEEWESLEPAIGELVRKFASRGKVHVDVEVTGDKSASEATWDEAAAAVALERLKLFSVRQGVEFKPTPELLWQVANSQRRANDFPTASGLASSASGFAALALAAVRAAGLISPTLS